MTARPKAYFQQLFANPYIQRDCGKDLSLLGKLFGPEISDRGIPNLARGETFRGAIRIKGEVRGDIRIGAEVTCGQG